MDLAVGITTQSGIELHNSVLHATAEPGQTYISGLDALLASKSVSPLYRGDVIEVQGTSGSGKTELMQFLAMTALLPLTWRVRMGGFEIEVHVGGKDQSVVWFDCTQRFDIDRIATFLRTHLSMQANASRPPGALALDPTTIEEKVQECLTRLHVFFPSASLQVAATLVRLPEYVKERTMPDVGYLFVDGLSEWAWNEQLAREQNTPAHPTPSAHGHFLAAIARVRSLLSPVIFISQWVLKESSTTHKSSSSHPFYLHHQPAPYPHISDPTPFIPAHDPHRAPLLPGSDKPTFFFKYHITCHLPPGTTGHGPLSKHENGTTGFTAVLRAQGGKEIGEWQFDIMEKAVYG